MSVIRKSETGSSRYRNNSNDFSFRALYNTERFQFSNKLAYSLTNIPHNDLSNNISYSSDLFPISKSSTTSSSKDWALNYNGWYFYAFKVCGS